MGDEIDDEAAYLRKREVEERDAADQAACMARTAHLDLADMYAERRAKVESDEKLRMPGGLDCGDQLTPE